MKRPSAAMIIAIVALVSSLTGGAVAATLITSADIKDGTIQLRDLSPAARAVLRGARGAQGPRGYDGLPGDAGQQGISGGFDPTKVSYVTGIAVALAPGQDGTAIASCTPGTQVIGGGYFTNIASAAASEQYGDGWSVIADNESSIVVLVNAYAVCAAP